MSDQPGVSFEDVAREINDLLDRKIEPRRIVLEFSQLVRLVKGARSEARKAALDEAADYVAKDLQADRRRHPRPRRQGAHP